MQDKLFLLEELAEQSSKEKAKIIATSKRVASGVVEYRNKNLVDYTARDIYSFSRHNKVIRSAQQELTNYGISSLASRFSTGTYPLHIALELKLSEMTRQPASILFSSKNQAILTLISCILDERDILILSEDLTGPYADAGFLAQVEICTFNAEDPQSLKNALERANFKRRKFVILDTASCYEGVIRDLPTLLSITNQLGAVLVTDESLSFGLIGSHGAGSGNHFNLIELPYAQILDFSAILGSFGAAICGTKELISLLLSRSNVLATEVPLSPVLSASLNEVLNLTELAIAEREKLLNLKNIFSDGILNLQFPNFVKPDLPIITLKFASRRLAGEFQSALFHKGFLSELHYTLKTRSEESFVTFYISASHSIEQINHTLEAISLISSRLS